MWYEKVLDKVKTFRIKKLFNCNNKLKVGLFGTVILMSVGYAAINTSLGVEGLISIAESKLQKVFISSLKIDGIYKNDKISGDGESFTFNSSDIKNEGDSIVDYEISNASGLYDADVSVSCEPEIHNSTTLSYDATTKLLKNGESIAGKVTVSTASGSSGSLYDAVKKQSLGSDSVLNYSNVSSSSNGEGVYTTTNTDSGKEVYFYRGNVSNNNVIFAGYCWQILRTTETGGVKLFYNGIPDGGQCSKPSGVGISSTTFQVAGNDNAYAGYMYGKTGSSSYEETHKNTNSSKLKKEIDTWYEKNLLNTENEKFLEDTVWCNDRSIPTDITNWNFSSELFNTAGDKNGTGTVKTIYGFGIRGGSRINNTNPTLKCANKNDRFTVNDTTIGNGDLTYPIATVTGDELIYAGATGGWVASDGVSPANRNYFLYNDGSTCWSMSPAIYGTSNYVQGVALFTHGGLSSTWTSIGGREMGIRPAISLKPEVPILVGNGSFQNPYIVGSTSDVGAAGVDYTCKLNIKIKEESLDDLIGTEYCFGEECFNVIEHDGTNVKLLAKYNLLVGKEVNNGAISDISPSIEGYGLQSSQALGDKTPSHIYGSIEFGSSNEYATSSIKPHVDNYVNYLNTTYNLNAEGRLINVDELLKIGCVLGQGNSGCSATYNKNHEWLLRTTFWTGEKGTNANSIYLVGGDGFFAPVTSLTNNGNRGIRPVIVVAADKVDIDWKPSLPSSKVPSDWQDNGIFSDYYEQAFQKLQTLSLEEKVGQMIIPQYNSNTTVSDAIKNYHIGGTTFYAADFTGKTETQVKEMTAAVQAATKIPLITAIDEEGGKVVRASSNPNLIAEPFKYSQELYNTGGLPLITTDTVNKSAFLRNLGLNMNFAPVVDIADASAYIYHRTLGQSAEVTGQYAATVVNASKNTGVSYSLKHFPGYGNNSDTHVDSAVDQTSMEELQKKHLVPFKAGVEAGTEAVMITHNIVSALDKENPSSLSEAVHNLLFNDLKFTGIAITDDLNMGATKELPNKYTKAVLAGNNILLCVDYADAHTEILNAVKAGTISEEYLNYKVFKILAWKYYKNLLQE